MREILLSVVLMVVIGVVAAYGLEAMDWSAQSKYTTQSGNVRVN